MLLLKVIISVSQFCAVTPPFIQKKSHPLHRKCHILFIFALITTILIAAFVEKNFFVREGIIKMIVLYLNNLILYAFSYRAIIALNFWKKDQWYKLLENLSTGRQIKQKRFGYENAGFFLANLFYLSIAMYTMINWHDPQKLPHVINVIEQYLQFLYKCLCCVLLHMLSQRYTKLAQLVGFHLKRRKQRKVVPMSLIKHIEYEMCVLKQTVNIFNEIFGWPIALIILFSTIQLFNYIEFSVYFYEYVNFVEKIMAAIWILSFGIAPTIVLVLMCDYVCQKAKRMLPLTFKLRWCFKNCGTRENLELYELTSLVVGNAPRFTAANFFDVGKPLLLDIFGLAFTYVVVLIQFHGS